MLNFHLAFSDIVPYSVGDWRIRAKPTQPADISYLSPLGVLPRGQRPPLAVVSDEPGLLGHVFFQDWFFSKTEKNPLSRMVEIISGYQLLHERKDLSAFPLENMAHSLRHCLKTGAPSRKHLQRIVTLRPWEACYVFSEVRDIFTLLFVSLPPLLCPSWY